MGYLLTSNEENNKPNTDFRNIEQEKAIQYFTGYQDILCQSRRH